MEKMLCKKPLENIVVKGNNAGIIIFSFPQWFFFLPKTNLNFLVTFILSSANAFSLDWSKILLFGKELQVVTIC